MKRYRVLNIDFDSRAILLNTKIEDWWEKQVQDLHAQSQSLIKTGLIQDFGTTASENKLQNFRDLGAAPFSIVAYHNKFLRQIRYSFVIGGYYPALTGACALGERILNHLLLAHRDFFKSSPEYKAVYQKKSFDNWDVPINTLSSWNVLQPKAADAFHELKDARNRSIHFRPETDHNDRALALSAIQILGRVIDGQFSAFGMHPWFISDTLGATFLRKNFETNPFIKTVYIPNCVLVGPYHRLEHSDRGWIAHDEFPYEEREISDEEFTQLYNAKASHPTA